MKEAIIDILSRKSNLKNEEVEKLIEIPPNSEMGDSAFPCFILSKKLKKNPVEIAKELAVKIKSEKSKINIEKIEAKGPYINFFINKRIFINNAISINEDFGKAK